MNWKSISFFDLMVKSQMKFIIKDLELIIPGK